ncbi:transcriptional regulator, XRE family [Candidatus Moduliflexus flocculans]|uniref:Transcriptional regulator, XRE family n=1 Tax=Candidatus Moduliflexus flocculans TaxID=1499966 RepID=A0A081BSV1_9BACT|nr:transcriptional regulator, XRE family [Candidatus Moduliflexus flocculans]
MKKRNIGQEILEGIQAIKRGEGKSYAVDAPVDAKTIRETMKLSPSAFAALFGVSLKTVQSWETGTQQPRGAAKSLLLVASKYPDVLLELFHDHVGAGQKMSLSA